MKRPFEPTPKVFDHRAGPCLSGCVPDLGWTAAHLFDYRLAAATAELRPHMANDLKPLGHILEHFRDIFVQLAQRASTTGSSSSRDGASRSRAADVWAGYDGKAWPSAPPDHGTAEARTLPLRRAMSQFFTSQPNSTKRSALSIPTCLPSSVLFLQFRSSHTCLRCRMTNVLTIPRM